MDSGTLAAQVFQVVAPVFALALIGWGWVRAGLAYDVQFVTRLSMTLSIPCLIFMALARSDIDPTALRDTALAALVAYLAVAAVVWLLLRGAGLSMRTFAAPLTFGNTGNIGLPLAFFAFGPQGLDFAVVIFAVMAIMSFTIGVWVISGGGSPMAALREPMVWGTVAGAVFLMMDWQVPLWAANTLDLVGQIAIPLMLITLGVAISQLRLPALGQALTLSVIKLALTLGVAVAAGLWFGLPQVAFAALVLQLTTPVAVTSYMLAEKYKADSGAVAGLVVVSTLLCALAIPLLLGWLIGR